MTAPAVISQEEAGAVLMLGNAIASLTTALDEMPIGDIVATKAKVATIQTATKELGMSKEAQELAVEAIRRAEWALGRAIRKGQEEGVIRKHGDNQFSGKEVGDIDLPVKASPYDFASRSDLQGGGSDFRRSPGLLEIADSAPGIEDIGRAIDAAKAEGNLSRANVLRKAKGGTDCDRGPAVTRDMRAEQIRILAEQGYSSRQMPEKVGVSEESVRKIARDFDIEIPADKSVRGTRRVDSTRIVANTVTALEGLVMGVELVNFDDLDSREVSQWADSLTYSLRALNRFHKQIKETTHD